MHLLVVDDDTAIRRMFARTLAKLGTVDEAGNGIEALRFIATQRYDVMILDWHMPTMDGPALLRVLAEKPGPNGDTPVIVVTADPSPNARQDAMHGGAIYFIQKPVALGSLAVLVQTSIQQRQRHKKT